MSLVNLELLATVLVVIVIWIAPKRSQKQPVSFNTTNEEIVISSLLLAPESYPALDLIESQNFASFAAGGIWESAKKIALELGFKPIPEPIAELLGEIKNQMEKLATNKNNDTLEKELISLRLSLENKISSKKLADYKVALSNNENSVEVTWGENRLSSKLHLGQESKKVNYEFTFWLPLVENFSSSLVKAIEGNLEYLQYFERAVAESKKNNNNDMKLLKLESSLQKKFKNGVTLGNKYDQKVILELMDGAYNSSEDFEKKYLDKYLNYSGKLPSRHSPVYNLRNSMISFYETLILAGGEIINDFMDRTTYNGNSKIVATSNEAIPLAREFTPYSIYKKILVALISYLSTWGSYELIHKLEFSQSSKVFLALSLVFLTAFSILWALVDIDTMYLDMKSFYMGLSITWILLVIGIYLSKNLWHFIPGITMTILMVVIFELVNLLYKKLRGSDGMGLGDTMIILGTIGIPTAVSGAWQMGYRVTMLSFLLGVIGWVYNRVINNASKEEPFAFGPYLALGWMLAVISWYFTGGILPAGF